MPSLDYYECINTDTPLVLEVDGLRITLQGEKHMQVLVSAILGSNYGLHRFLSELAHQLEAKACQGGRVLAREELLKQLHAFFDADGF